MCLYPLVTYACCTTPYHPTTPLPIVSFCPLGKPYTLSPSSPPSPTTYPSTPSPSSSPSPFPTCPHRHPHPCNGAFRLPIKCPAHKLEWLTAMDLNTQCQRTDAELRAAGVDEASRARYRDKMGRVFEMVAKCADRMEAERVMAWRVKVFCAGAGVELLGTPVGGMEARAMDYGVLERLRERLVGHVEGEARGLVGEVMARSLRGVVVREGMGGGGDGVGVGEGGGEEAGGQRGLEASWTPGEDRSVASNPVAAEGCDLSGTGAAPVGDGDAGEDVTSVQDHLAPPILERQHPTAGESSMSGRPNGRFFTGPQPAMSFPLEAPSMFPKASPLNRLPSFISAQSMMDQGYSLPQFTLPTMDLIPGLFPQPQQHDPGLQPGVRTEGHGIITMIGPSLGFPASLQYESPGPVMGEGGLLGTGVPEARMDGADEAVFVSGADGEA